MENQLFKRLLSLKRLKRAWHLARNDAKNSFIYDSFRYNDFAFNLDENLQNILEALKKDVYRPSPLLMIDIPKTTLSVRPGSALEIEDWIVLFAIIDLIAPRIDKEFPETVYSYRLKPKKDRDILFKDREILEYTFLKKKTIQTRIKITIEWYEQWPKFISQSIFAYEHQGYKYLSISDISAYFENINLNILRDTIMEFFPNEQKIINLLMSFLTYWTWPTTHGRSIDRGIPQGNSISSFLGNVYLIPLDRAFQEFAKKNNCVYLRYMDDVKVFSKTPEIARLVIFEMNNILRELHLNMQGSKTVIKNNEEIREELIDERQNQLEDIIGRIAKKKTISTSNKLLFEKELKNILKKIKRKNIKLQDSDLRLFRRLVTGFMLIQSSHLIKYVLIQMSLNPDPKVTGKALSYFKIFPKNGKVIDTVSKFLLTEINLFIHQEAMFLSILRFADNISDDIKAYCRKKIYSKSIHWYIRVQSALLLSKFSINPRSITKMEKIFDNETNVEIKRSLVHILVKYDKEKQYDFIRKVIFTGESKLTKLGCMLLTLREKKDESLKEIASIFRNPDEFFLQEQLYKLEVIKFNTSKDIQKELLRRIRKIRRRIKNTILLKNLQAIEGYLKEELQ